MSKVKEYNGFIVTTALKKLRKLTKRVKKIPGGTSASKTYSILPILIDRAAKGHNLEISVVSESIPHLRKGALKDFLKIMKATGRYIDTHWNRTLLTYSFGSGSYIEFFSADQEDKVRGPRRNILYINECNNIKFDTYHQLAIRTDLEIWLDYNPTHEFWADTELADDPDVESVTLTYKDNEGLSDSIVKEIEKALYKGFYDFELTGSKLFSKSNIKNSYWANWWKVYGLGFRGSLEGVIFSNWSTTKELPEDARLIGYGMDFGYSNDPTAIVGVYKWNEYRILHEVLYKKGLVNSEIAEFIPDKEMIYADSAEPKSIEEIKRLKKRIKGVKKGKDSINFGIQIMQSQNYLVTSSSLNIINELRNYCWDTDKNGKKLNKPIDKWNHCFVGETLITTSKGDIPIEEIKEGDLVLTREGYKPVLKKFDNGIKKVIEQRMQLDTFSLSLTGTKTHKIWTAKKWKELSKLKEGNKICLVNHLMEKNTGYTQMKDIIAEEEKDCIELFGNTSKGLYQKDITSTILTETPQTIISKTSVLSAKDYTLDMKGRKEQTTIKNGLETSMKKEEKQLKSGTHQKRVRNGTKNNGKDLLVKSKRLKETVTIAEKNTKQNSLKDQSFVTTIAKQHQEEKGLRRVYDLMVKDCHEYFANGILVHNCIDAIRYHEMEDVGNKSNWFVI